MRWLFQELEKSKHDASWMARIAMAHGVFLEDEKDSLKPYAGSEAFIFLDEFLRSGNSWDAVEDDVSALSALTPRAVFEKYYKLGIDLRRHGAFPVFRRYVDALGASKDIPFFIARLALCHGLFFKQHYVLEFERPFRLLSELLPE